MRAIAILLAAPFFVVGEELSLPEDFEPDPKRRDITLRVSAFEKYQEEKSAMRANYRKRIAKVFLEADRVEIFLLSFTMHEPEGNSLEEGFDEGGDPENFYIAPYQLESKILGKRRLEGDLKTELLTALSELLNESEDFMGGAFCHYPIHGIRLFKAQEMIFETSLCWKCDNYFFEYPMEQQSEWIGFSVKALENFMSKHMPIPKAEFERFEAKFGNKKKRAEQDGAEQPATAPESKPEGEKKPKPESEGRSQ